MADRPYVQLLRALDAGQVSFAIAGGFAVVLMEELDIVLVTPFPWTDIAASRVWREIDGVRVPVVGRKLLRLMKLASGRDKDRSDAELLGDRDA